MADYNSLPSPMENSRKTSSFFGSPRLFTCFAAKGFPDTESIMSPTSILDSKPFTVLRNPFWSDPKSPKPESRAHFQKLDSKGVGLGLVDALIGEKSDSKEVNSVSRMVVLGSQLKIQIPTLPPFNYPTDSPPSPGDFGIKTRNSQLGSFSPGFSPSPVKKSPFGSSNSNIDIPNSPGAFSSLSAAEMELSEEYTCVISYGPNPRTTHIFDDCILESCCGVVKYSASRKENETFPSPPMSYPSESFLSFCHNCKKNLGIGKDIYMYRGEKAFCSSDCRYKEMMLEEGMDKSETDDNVFGKGDQPTTTVKEDSVLSNKSVPHKNKYSLSSISCFGVDLTPDNIAVAMVYFVQGVLGLARLAVSFYLKDDLHLDPAETAVISGFSSLPWLVKPLYGFISDSFPLFGYRRRSYLVLSGLLGAFSWFLMATFVDSKYSAAFSILIGSLSVAFSDVVVDSMVVERARGESQSMSGSLQSLCWGSSAFGGIVSAYFSGSLVEAYGVRFVFGATSLLPLITSAVSVLVKEQPVRGPARGVSLGNGFIESSKNNFTQLWGAVKQPSVLLPTLFIFLWQATPQSDSAMFFFTTNKLGFTPEFLGRVKLVTSVASLIGVGLYNGFLKKVPLRKIFLVMTLIGTALGMTQVLLVTGLNRQFGISDEWFAIGDSLIITVLGQASFMPVLVLAARICPQGMEATLFATLMSISNGGSVLGGLIGAGLTQVFGVTKDRFDNLAFLIILCNLSSLLPLPLLGLLPGDEPDTKDNTDIEMKSN